MVNRNIVININTEEVLDGISMNVGRQDNSAKVSGLFGLKGSGGDNDGAVYAGNIYVES